MSQNIMKMIVAFLQKCSKLENQLKMTSNEGLASHEVRQLKHQNLA